MMEGMSPASCLTQDDVEALLLGLSALDLSSASQVCTAWYAAYERLKRIPQWVGALSRASDAETAAKEACQGAMGQIRCKPDVAFIFTTPGYDM
jgi:hypothetical protein